MGWSLICVLVALTLCCYGLVFDLCYSVSHFVAMGWSLICVLVSITLCCYGLVFDLCSSVSHFVAMGWSLICDRGISWSNSRVFIGTQ